MATFNVSAYNVLDELEKLAKTRKGAGMKLPEPEPAPMPELTREQVLEQIQDRRGRIALSVSPKGCLAVTLPNRKLPVSLYRDEWQLIFSYLTEMQGFMRANSDLKDHLT